LAALDAPEPEGAADVRAVLTDDGQSIRLTLYSKAERLAVAVLDPAAALALAGGLLDAAQRRLTKLSPP
ncbi:MAG TPA: hypothetical protein VGS13_11365, partial [Stellaceae bacterium]|nr:hypothetical protein [Stellaceae bacterium]